MIQTASKKITFSFCCTYLISLAAALYFTKGVSALHPAYCLVLTVSLAGLILNFLFSFFLQNKSPQGFLVKLIPFLVFQILQGGLAFAVAHYVFNFNLLSSLAFPAGAFLSFLAWLIIISRYPAMLFGKSEIPVSLLGLKLIVYFAVGVAIALRLDGILGGLMFGLAVLNSFWIGLGGLEGQDEKSDLWCRGVLAVGLLTVGRAAIQYYLLQGNYATLGIIITHSYTFASLFAGLWIPFAFLKLQKEKLVPTALLFILFGLIIPFAGGIFVHIRPMSAYLFGLVASSFLAAILYSDSYELHLLTYLSLAISTATLPLIQKYPNLSRIIRIEILGGIAVLLILIFVGMNLVKTKNSKAAS